MRVPIPQTWLIGGAVFIPLMYVIAGFLYYPALLHSGVLSPDADSIGIPIFGSFLAAPVLMILLLLYSLPAWFRYDGSASILAGSTSSPWRLATGIALYGMPAVIVLAMQLQDWFTPMPAFEHWWSIVTVPLIVWLLLLRAAVSVERASKVAES